MRLNGGSLLACLLAGLSGAAALAWQGLWTLQFSASLGHEFVAVMGVVAAIFIGLSAGAWWFGAAAARSLRPWRWYALLEGVIGAWGALLCVVLPALAPWLSPLVGEQPSPLIHGLLAFAVPGLLLLPATTAMGATLPVMVRQLAGDARALERIYAANTAGAVIGVLAAVFWIVPGLGLRAAGLTIAGMNLACALVAVIAWRSSTIVAQAPDAAAHGATGADRRLPLLALLASGFLGIGHEALAVRVLAQAGEGTVYSHALMLALFLCGTAVGAALTRRRGALSPPGPPVRLLLLTAMLVAAGLLSLAAADRIAAWPPALVPGWRFAPLAGEALAALCVMGPPALGMGALFAALCRWVLGRGVPLGLAVAVNTAGAAIAPAAIGMVLIPWLGPARVAALLVTAYLVLAAAMAPARHRWRIALPALALLVLAQGLPPLRLLELTPGERVRFYRDGIMASVSISEDPAGVLRLRIDNRAQEGSSQAGLVEQRLALLPLLMHPDPRRALFLGLGTGYTAQVAAIDPRLRVDAVELLPEVVEASRIFMNLPGAPRPQKPPRLIVADARRFVLAGQSGYDLIVADLFHPARSGAASLYTREHFQALRGRLAPGGVVCQWLALHQMEVDTFRQILAAFREAFPTAVAVLASNSLDTPVIGLLARPDEPLPGPQAVAARHRAARLAYGDLLERARLVDEYAVLGALFSGPAGLQAAAADAPVNRDDRPVVAHAAAWDTYAPQRPPRERLAALLDAATPWPDLAAAPIAWEDPAQAAPMAAYWQARSRYLALGMALPPGLPPPEILTRLAAPLGALLADSPRFTPAADTLAALRAAAARAPHSSAP